MSSTVTVTRLTRRAMTLAAGLLVAACGSGVGEGTMRGAIAVDGSSTVAPITEAIAEEFGLEEPRVEVAVGVSGTGGGFEKFCRGETDLSNASRRIKDEEVAACRAAGIEPVELTVALDGLAVVANPGVDWVDCLTIAQLKAIWDEGSRVGRWNQVDPSFPGQRLALFGPGTDSGTFDYFTDHVNGEEGRSRRDYTPAEDDNVLVRGIQGQKGALGYFGVAFYELNRATLKALAVDAGDGCVKPDRAAITSGRYPLSRPLFVYASQRSLARPVVAAFLRFYLDVVNELVADVGYVALPSDLLAEAGAALEAAARGATASTTAAAP